MFLAIFCVSFSFGIKYRSKIFCLTAEFKTCFLAEHLMDPINSFDESEQPLSDKLLDNLFYICQRVDPIDVLIYLRQGRVITKEDEEFIQNPYIHVTRQLRAGMLIRQILQAFCISLN